MISTPNLNKDERRGRRFERQPLSPEERANREFEQKLIDLRRVARVVAGGKRFSFRATLVIGDSKGRVGVGVGKGADTALAIEKAFRDARKNFITVPLTDKKSIPHEVRGFFKAARILIKPAPEGRGLVVGGAARTVLNFAGVKNATAKILSHTKNKITNARVTIEALKQLKLRDTISEKNAEVNNEKEAAVGEE